MKKYNSRISPVLIIQKTGPETNFLYLPNGDEKIAEFNSNLYSVSTHGTGIVGEKFVSSSEDILESLKKIKHKEFSSFGEEIRGSLCLYFSSAKKCWILPDPLGGGMLLEYKDDDICAYSSDMQSLIQALEGINKKPKKNFDYLTEIISTGNGGFFSSSFQKIKPIPQFSYVVVDNTGCFTKEYKIRSTLFEHPASLDDLFEKTRSEILSNILAVSKAGNKIKTSHLTGGFDSRLVLSAIMHLNLQDEFQFMCSGRMDLPDKKISYDLCGHFNLAFTDDDGLARKAYQPGHAFDDTYGMLRQEQGIGGNKNHILLSGGYGECLRSFFSYRTNVEPGKTINLGHLYDRSFFNQDQPRFLSSHFYQKYYNEFQNFIESCQRNGLRDDAILDFAYLNIRNRYYVGLISLYHSNLSPRFDPLYSLSGIKLALHSSLKERSKNFIGIQLMNSFCPDLLRLPFDSERIDKEYEERCGNIVRENFNGRQPILMKTQKEKPSNSRVVKKEHIDKAKLIGASLQQIANLEEVQIELRRLFNEYRKDISLNFDWKMINRLLNPNLKNRVHIRSTFALHDSLCWYKKN